MLKFQKKLGAIGVLGVVVCLLTLALPFAAGAASAPPTTSGPAPVTQQYQAAVKTLDPYVKVVDNRYVLTAPADALAQIDPGVLDSLKQGIAEANAVVMADHLTINAATGQATVAVSDRQVREAVQHSHRYHNARGVTYGGVTRLILRWWGYTWYLSSYVVSLCATGATAAVFLIIGALLPGVGWFIAGGIVSAVASKVAGDHRYPALIVSQLWTGAVRSIGYQ